MSSLKGPSIRLSLSSLARYSATGSGCRVAENKLFAVLRKGLVREKLILNPHPQGKKASNHLEIIA